jgi:hypothetical protein
LKAPPDSIVCPNCFTRIFVYDEKNNFCGCGHELFSIEKDAETATSGQRHQEAFEERRKSVRGPKGQIPKNNTPELAQWYIERGKDQSMNGGMWLFVAIPVGLLLMAIGVASFVSPIVGGVKNVASGIFAVFLGVTCLPVGYFMIAASFGTYTEGRRKVEIGKEMNRVAGRSNYVRPHGMAPNEFHRGWSSGPDTRFGPVPETPPVKPLWD